MSELSPLGGFSTNYLPAVPIVPDVEAVEPADKDADHDPDQDRPAESDDHDDDDDSDPESPLGGEIDARG
ncbi:MAG: hypothetical protein JO353_13875 [Phycisphaerae bacterium]|nr:hypothetical protein [Phycisphaerae bacterium]